LKLMLEPEWVNVCFQVKWKSAKAICDKLDAEWIIKVSYGFWRWEEMIRLMCVNADMTNQDIDNFFIAIKSAKI
jgi:hypothetical protein